MKYHVFISKKEILTSVIFMVGLLFLLHGIHSAYKIKHALNLNDLSENELKEGVCVNGNIDTYIGKHVYGNNRFFGVSHSFTTLFGQSYNFYTIPVGRRSYICIMVSDRAFTDQLEAFENGHGENVYFEGEVIKPPVEANWAWYAPIEDFRTEDLIDSLVIKEKNFEKNKDILFAGILLVVTAVLLFFSAGGLKSFVMEEREDDKPVRRNC